ncbi:universal stress protein [Mariniblastus fucicola]|uniref:Universal stress protein family protein n=1 Tax=Mariniblastus fucicola TaxID=980251 RepID=A0A5B9PH34_9BACT|nr:universal stress protein [Mariniblastus fucicola]QEG24919.1 Universal stress protein family protein [Mariniblastus fucicola]
MVAKTKRGTIVVPWNFTESCRQALDFSLDLTAEPSLVRVVHIESPRSVPRMNFDPDCTESTEMKGLQEKFRDQLPDEEPYCDIQLYVAYGPTASEIAAFAHRCRAGLIVLGHGDKPSLTRLIIGSLASRIVKFARCPVLVLKGELDEGNPLAVGRFACRGNNLRAAPSSE